MARRNPNNSSHYWWDKRTPGLSLLCADFTTQEYPPHSHEAFVIAVTENGGSVIKSRGRVEQAHASALFAFNPAEPHSGWMGASDVWRYRSFYLTQSAIDRVADALGVEAVPCFSRNLIDDADLIASFLALHHALEDGEDIFRERELLFDSFGRLFQRHGSGGSPIEPAPRDRRLIETVIDMMKARYAEKLCLEELSAAAGLTPFQLIGLFKRGLGMTPHSYLTQVRLYRACRSLRLGAPIAEAAAATGFYDQSALTRHFKRFYGMTPRQYARAAAA